MEEKYGRTAKYFPSKCKLIGAEVCFAGIAIIALIETIAGAILLTFSGFISIVNVRPHLYVKLFFSSSGYALNRAVADLVLNFTQPNLHYKGFLGEILKRCKKK